MTRAWFPEGGRPPDCRQTRDMKAETLDDDESDGQLIRRFVEGRDEQAFAALVERRGALVAGVCARMARCREDAEDAFQAVPEPPSLALGSLGAVALASLAFRLRPGLGRSITSSSKFAGEH
jgi:hypothetical protein